MKKTYKIEVDCANCANLMEEAARKTPGIQTATVNFKQRAEARQSGGHKDQRGRFGGGNDLPSLWDFSFRPAGG